MDDDEEDGDDVDKNQDGKSSDDVVGISGVGVEVLGGAQHSQGLRRGVGHMVMSVLSQ